MSGVDLSVWGITEEEWKNKVSTTLEDAMKGNCKGCVIFVPHTENTREPHQVMCISKHPDGSRLFEARGLINNKITVLYNHNKVWYIPDKKAVVADKPKASKLAYLPNAMRILTEVMDYGDKTHPPLSWLENDPAVHLDKFYRHALIYGETDPESGMPSLWHAFCNLAMYIELTCRKKSPGGKT